MSEVYKALLKVQTELRNPKFDSVNPHFRSKYASLAEVLNTVKPVLSNNGLVLLQFLRCDGNVVSINTKIVHVESEEELDYGTLSLALPSRADNPVQALGAAITYLRRYSILTALGVVGDEDSDGEYLTEKVSNPPGRSGSEEEQRRIALDLFRGMGLPSKVIDKLSQKPLDELRSTYASLKSLMAKVEQAGLKATLVDVLDVEELEDVLKGFRKNQYAYLQWLEGVAKKAGRDTKEAS